MRNYRAEFPDFGTMDVAIPQGFSDVSWHHDAAPSFGKVLCNGEYALLMIDYLDVAKRETPALDRYTAMLYANEGASEPREVYATENWAAMIKWLEGKEQDQIVTSEMELYDLVARARGTGALVEVTHDRELYHREGRWITQFVRVTGLRGCGPSPMPALTAAEVLRQCLFPTSEVCAEVI